ncbi:hypothetical protein ADIARSV_1911 [Arcticibacter svalbardensis MN12-7]|uniref:Uncharacterized protein n=1 Tax=Arcticibacter svalbardensis MN12-7 TaxID=1150600 RepID=R9GTS4_9SPHI|nr:hypothetical protein ADIARSV_1911 [Arcticibacter svalbardensis MN12-7]
MIENNTYFLPGFNYIKKNYCRQKGSFEVINRASLIVIKKNYYL